MPAREALVAPFWLKNTYDSSDSADKRGPAPASYRNALTGKGKYPDTIRACPCETPHGPLVEVQDDVARRGGT